MRESVGEIIKKNHLNEALCGKFYLEPRYVIVEKLLLVESEQENCASGKR
jgi:hypothetical protein